jgi:hypothetical protein
MNTDRLTDEQIEDIEARCGHALNGDAVSSDVRALLGERARLAAQVEELRSSVEHHAPDCEPCRNALAHAALAAPSVPPDRPQATEGVATGSEEKPYGVEHAQAVHAERSAGYRDPRSMEQIDRDARAREAAWEEAERLRDERPKQPTTLRPTPDVSLRQKGAAAPVPVRATPEDGLREALAGLVSAVEKDRTTPDGIFARLPLDAGLAEAREALRAATPASDTGHIGKQGPVLSEGTGCEPVAEAPSTSLPARPVPGPEPEATP